MLKYLQLLARTHKPPYELRTEFLVGIASVWGQIVGGVRVSLPPEGLSQPLFS